MLEARYPDPLVGESQPWPDHWFKPRRNRCFFSTHQPATPKAYLFAVIGAEYWLKMLPKGTHEYARFIKPSELDEWARMAELELKHITGLSYNPLSKNYKLGRDVDVNYMTHYLAALDPSSAQAD